MTKSRKKTSKKSTKTAKAGATPKAAPAVRAALEAALDAAATGLPTTAAKRMFGCHALFADGQVFALVWKTGAIGVRLEDPSAFAKAMALQGSKPWTAGPRTMAHWVLLAPATDARRLKAWVQNAHALALEPRRR
jgi:hypothetical protein